MRRFLRRLRHERLMRPPPKRQPSLCPSCFSTSRNPAANQLRTTVLDGGKVYRIMFVDEQENFGGLACMFRPRKQEIGRYVKLLHCEARRQHSGLGWLELWNCRVVAEGIGRFLHVYDHELRPVSWWKIWLRTIWNHVF